MEYSYIFFNKKGLIINTVSIYYKSTSVLFGCLDKDFCLFVLRLNVPVNNFSVMSGRSQCFLGLTSTAESECVLLKDTTRCRLWGSNQGPLNSESDALPLRHHAEV